LIAIDTSALVRFFEGAPDRTRILVRDAIRAETAAVPPIVLAELFSNPHMRPDLRVAIMSIDIIPIREGRWERAGLLRAELLRRDLKAKLADCLIAQSCIDNDAPLITYDRDFRHFESAGLRVI